MKSILMLVLLISVASCSGTKKAIENQPEQSNKVNTIEEIQDEAQNNNSSKQQEGEDFVIALKENDSTVKIVSVDSSKVVYTRKTTIKMPPLIAESIKKDSSSKSKSSLRHVRWDFLLKDYVTNEGKVDYKKFKKNRSSLTDYITRLQDNFLEIEASKKEDKLAYWINAYNALTVDLILRNYPLNSIKDIKDPWDQRLWKFGDKWLNLNDIEHKILRKMDEPRIHFAIVCASESCPKLLNEAFTADNLEAQLTSATKVFLSDTSKNEISEDQIKLSKIFKWFAKDFKTNGTLIDFLNQYSKVTISNKAKKSFKDYDWSLNN